MGGPARVVSLQDTSYNIGETINLILNAIKLTLHTFLKLGDSVQCEALTHKWTID
jgi:hypothetical protein